MAFTAAALVSYGLSGFLSKSFGLSLLSEVWKLEALAVAAAIATGFAYPLLRGVKRGDQLVAFVPGKGPFTQSLLVTALEDGRSGNKIRVELWNGGLAEGVVSSYSSTFSPAAIELTEAEAVKSQ